jgi:transposase
MARKVKYDLAFKLKCVLEVLENYTTANILSSRKGFDESSLRKWILDYQTKGIDGLTPKSTNNKYSQSFKYKVIRTIERENLSIQEASIRFNIPSSSVIIKWQKDFAIFGIDGLQPKSKGRPTNMNIPKRKLKSKKPLTREEELLLENERLRCEVALLKKFNALIQAEEEKLKKLGGKP